jgi:hypothetical protein
MLIIGLAGVALIYLIYPSLGIFELIPDAIPVLGSLDEASATIILINTFRYYGFDFTRFYGRRTPQLPGGQNPRLPER